MLETSEQVKAETEKKYTLIDTGRGRKIPTLD